MDPSAWLLLTLPFLSSLVVRSVPALRALATRMIWLTMPVGIAGLALLSAGLLGLLPKPYGLPLAVLGGIVSGYTVFTLPRSGSDDDDWRRSGPPPDDPPPPPSRASRSTGTSSIACARAGSARSSTTIERRPGARTHERRTRAAVEQTAR